MERSIIHLNVADFAVAVERIIDSRLRQRPVIVAPLQAARAMVYDMSDEAYRDGVRKGMALNRAARLCRQAVLLPPRPERYGRAMQAIIKRVLPFSPLVEEAAGDGHLLSAAHRFSEDTNDLAQAQEALKALVEECGSGLRTRRLACRRVAVSLAYADGIRATRQAVASRPVANNVDLLALARAAMHRAWTRRIRLRQLHLVCDRLSPAPPVQLELFAGPRAVRKKKESITAAVDRIRARFGAACILAGQARAITAN